MQKTAAATIPAMMIAGELISLPFTNEAATIPIVMKMVKTRPTTKIIFAKDLIVPLDVVLISIISSEVLTNKRIIPQEKMWCNIAKDGLPVVICKQNVEAET